MRNHQYSVGVVRLTLAVVLSCAGSQRSAAAVLALFANWLPGVDDTPCANTGRMWLLRLGLYELTRPKEQAEDWVWIMDHTLQLGPYKCLVIVGVRLSVWRENGRPLQHTDLALLNLTPMEQATGERVHEALAETTLVTGVPRMVLSDGGAELERGMALLRSEHPGVDRVYDVKHKMALFLKKELTQDERWGAFIKEVTTTRLGITQTALAFLLPQTLKTKARYMNLGVLVQWGQSVLAYLDQPRINPQAPVDRAKLDQKLGWLANYRQPLQDWSELLAIAEATEDLIRRQGYHQTAEQSLSDSLSKLTKCDAARRMSAAALAFVADQSALAQSPDERLPGHSEVLESLIGRYKQLQSSHSKGGMTAMLLSFGAIVSQKTHEVIEAALTSVSTSAVNEWCRKFLGVTLQSQRHFALGRNKNRINIPPSDQ